MKAGLLDGMFESIDIFRRKWALRIDSEERPYAPGLISPK
jgi:hypothetical protein